MIATFKAKKKTKGYVFVIYDSLMSAPLLGLYVTKKAAKFVYSEQNGSPGLDASPEFAVNMADGK